MTARRAAVAGFCLGLVMATVRCGPQVTPGPTSLFVHVSRASSFGADVFAYTFSGSMDGAEAFAETQLPATIDASAPLNGPQTVRINFSDDYDGHTVELVVYAQGSGGSVVGIGTGSTTLKKKTDVPLSITVQPLTSVPDGGDGFDAGQIRSCGCDAGCCSSDGGCFRPLVFPVGSGVSIGLSLCGQSALTCNVLCDFPLANLCVNGGCQCGNKPACSKGEWCVTAAGVSNCVCNEGTACDGCCSANGQNCLNGANDLSCGRAGNTCVNCVTGGRGCKAPKSDELSYGYCGALPTGATCSLTSCLSGAGCIDAGYPVCRLGIAPHTCYACDLFRSDRCATLTASGCACGATDQCPPYQLCYHPDGGSPTCVGIVSQL